MANKQHNNLILLLIMPILLLGCNKGLFGNKTSKQEYQRNNIKTRLSLKFNVDEKNNDFGLKKQLQKLQYNIEKESNDYSGINKELYWQAETKSLLKSTLASLGYYKNSVRSTIIYPENPQSKRQKIRIEYDIKLGKIFEFNQISITHAQSSDKNIKLPPTGILNIKPGSAANARDSLKAVNRIKEYLEENNCLLNIDVTHEAKLDMPKQVLDINFIVTVNDQALIRRVLFDGHEKVKPEFLEKVVTIKPGTCYRKNTINEAIGDLQKTGLFNSIVPSHPKTADNDGKIDLTYKLIERKSKTIKGGASYGTDLGFGLTAGWINRNLIGEGEKISTNMFVNEKEQFFDLVFSKPMFRRRNQKLKLGLELENERKKAYDSRAIKVSGGLERRFNKKITAGAGSICTYTQIKEQDKSKDFLLVGIPAFVTNDGRKNKLNPSQGVYTNLEITPTLNYNQARDSFIKSKIIAATYFGFGSGKIKDRYAPVLALRGTFGFILGPETKYIPANERFYLGGINSTRGYRQQSVGRVSDINVPLGGSILAEATAELRLKITDNWGLVTFYDIGTNDSIEIKDFDQQFLSSVGFGIRLFNDFIPLRFDFAIPTRRIESSNGLFQIYLGIGHSF